MPDDIDPERLVREVTFAVEGDGRPIEARIVPYNTTTQVVDSPANGGTGVPYLERWLPGVFEKQTKALDKIKVLLNFEHGRGISNVVGHAVALREDPDALYGTFRVHPGPDGDKALHMVNEDVLTALSLEAIPRRNNRTHDGIVERVKATLENVALVRRGAYSDAMVLAVREAVVETPEPDSAKVLEVEETLKRMGVSSLPRTISERPWNPSRTRFTDEQWAQSCVAGIPVLEPDGEINRQAVERAALKIASVPSAQRGEAARKLVRLHRRAGLEVPPTLKRHASI
jgi:HK97 family phage prohead protease